MKRFKNRKTGEIVQVISFNGDTERFESDYVSYIDSKGVEHQREQGLNMYWDFEEVDSNKNNYYSELSLLDVYDILDGDNSKDLIDFKIFLRVNLRKIYPGILDKEIYYFTSNSQNESSYELLNKIFTSLSLGYSYFHKEENNFQNTIIINKTRLIKIVNGNDKTTENEFKIVKGCLTNGKEIDITELECNLITISELYYNRES